MSTPYQGVPANVSNATLNSVIGVSNTTPMVVQTATPHGYATNDPVFIFGISNPVQANSNENEPWTITVVDSTHFSLNGSGASGAFSGSPGTCIDQALLPFFSVPANGDVFNADAWNVSVKALADRTQFLASKLPWSGYTQIAQYVTAQSDDTWTQWASATGTGTVWTPMAATTYFSAIEAVCNNQDYFEVVSQLGNVTVSGNQGAVGVCYMLQAFGTSNYANQVIGGGNLVPSGYNGPINMVHRVGVAAASGTGSIAGYSSGTITLDSHVSGLTSAAIGASVTISGAANAGNNGTFTINGYTGGGGDTIEYLNPNGVYPDANSGSLEVQVDNMAFNFRLMVQGFSGTEPTYSMNGHRQFVVNHYRPVSRIAGL